MKLSLTLARRMALHAQGLAATPQRRQADAQDISGLVARIGCLQLDPVSAVARSPELVLHARLGTLRPGALDAAAYRDRALFDQWAHEASLVHVADLPLHLWSIERRRRAGSTRWHRSQQWLDANDTFVSWLLENLREHGPKRAQDIEDRSQTPWPHGYWTDEVSSRQTVARVLGLLWTRGYIGVSRRDGAARVWDLFERCLPDGLLAATEPLDQVTGERTQALRALRMLGVARAPHVRNHFLRDTLPDATGTLEALVAEGLVARVEVATLKGTWYAAVEDLEAAPALAPGRLTAALSPFDNLLCDRARADELFGFDHRLEIYVPASKRRWGYYVLPILAGERFVARADLKIDRATGVLEVLSLHREGGRPAPRQIALALERLAAQRGAEAVGPYP